MRRSRKGAIGALAVAVLTLGLALSGCGAQSTGRVRLAATASTPAVTPSPTDAATPSPTESTIAGPVQEFPGCSTATSIQAPFDSVGALSVERPARALDYPSELLPSNPPDAPYRLTTSAVSSYHPNPPVNPSLGYYLVELCNKTGAAHTLTSLAIDIASFSPSSGPTNVWHLCADGPYDAATKQGSGGCGGGIAGSAMASATLSNDNAGASAPVSGLAWPVTIDPGKSVELVVSVHGLTSQGTYALSFGVGVDGAAPVPVQSGDGSFLIAPSATAWTGTACQTPAMQAQIPAASQDTYYVCPPAT